MKTFRGTGLFALFVIGLALASYFIVYRGEQRKNEAKDKASQLLSFQAEDVTEVTVDGVSKINLKKVDGRWQLLQPVEYPGDVAEVENFVRSLVNERSLDLVREDENVPWNVFGLDKPAGSITVAAGTQLKKLILSTRKTYNQDLYMRIEGENKVFLVSSAFSGYLSKDAKSLRDKTVFSGDPTKISEFRVQTFKNGSPQLIHLVRTADKKSWQFKGDVRSAVDEAEVKKYLDELKGLRALDFAAEDQSQLGKYDLTSNEATKIEVVNEGGKLSEPDWQIEISPLNPQGQTYVVASGLKPVIEVYKTAADRLRVQVDDFRDKAEPFNFKTSEVRKITYRSTSFHADLVKEAGVWKQKDAKPGEDIAKDQVDTLLKSLNAMRVAQFVGAGKGKGLNPPKNLIALRDGEDKLILAFRWGDEFQADKQTLTYVSTSLTRETVAVEAAKIKELPAQTLYKHKAEKQKKEVTPPAPPNTSKTPLTPEQAAHVGH